MVHKYFCLRQTANSSVIGVVRFIERSPEQDIVKNLLRPFITLTSCPVNSTPILRTGEQDELREALDVTLEALPLEERDFLGATKHLYNWLCPSVGWLIGNAYFDDPHVAPYWPTWLCFFKNEMVCRTWTILKK